MLELFYCLNNPEQAEATYPFPFVYLHGQAEDKNISAFAAGGSAPDICRGSVPLSELIDHPLQVGDVRKIDCTVDGIPSLMVLHAAERAGGSPHLCGRVALLHDHKAIVHVLDYHAWR